LDPNEDLAEQLFARHSSFPTALIVTHERCGSTVRIDFTLRDG
jgi:hypothetical protein